MLGLLLGFIWLGRPRRDASRRLVTLSRSHQVISYLVWPPEAADDLGSRRVALHLHGMLASADDVEFMMQCAEGDPTRLREQGAIIAIDRPGFGQSPPAADGSPTTLQVAQLVREFAAALGLVEYALVGYSAGGRIALATASESPPGLSRVVLVAAPWHWGDADAKSAYRYWPYYTVLRLVAGPWMVGALGMVEHQLVQVVGKSVANYFAQGSWAAAWEAHTLQTPAQVSLASIECPVHIFHGTEDSLVDQSHATRLSKRLVDAMVYLRPGTHITIAKHSVEIFETACGFL